MSVKKTDLKKFHEYLQEKENARSTIEKYMRDVKKFFGFAAGEGEINKELLIKYKQWLMEQLRLKRIRIQRTDIQYLERSLERAE